MLISTIPISASVSISTTWQVPGENPSLKQRRQAGCAMRSGSGPYPEHGLEADSESLLVHQVCVIVLVLRLQVWKRRATHKSCIRRMWIPSRPSRLVVIQKTSSGAELCSEVSEMAACKGPEAMILNKVGEAVRRKVETQFRLEGYCILQGHILPFSWRPVLMLQCSG